MWCKSVGDRVSFRADQSDTARIRRERIEEKLAQREHRFGPVQEYHLPGTAHPLVFHTAAGIRSIRETAGDFQRLDPVLDEQRAQRLRRAVQVVEAGYCNASTTCSGGADSATVRAVRGLYFSVDVITDVPGSQLAAGAAAMAPLLAAVMGFRRFDSPARARSIQRLSGAQLKARQRALQNASWRLDGSSASEQHASAFRWKMCVAWGPLKLRNWSKCRQIKVFEEACSSSTVEQLLAASLSPPSRRAEGRTARALP